MLLDGATSESNKERFIKRIVDNETVYHLASENGVANSVSNDCDEQEVLMFWSDSAYARRVQSNGFEDYDISEITLFDFLFRWLPGMSGDDVLAGVNWNQELVGRECDPFELRTEIEDEMANELLFKYENRYAELVKNV